MNRIRINLLPYREQRRAFEQKLLTAMAAIAVAAAVGIVGVGHFILEGLKENQDARNQKLSDGIAVLNTQIKEIEELKAKNDALNERKKAVEELQNRRSDLVHLFDELGRLLPDGVFLKSLRQSGDKLDIQGVAQSSARVSELMRNLDASDWFGLPILVQVQATSHDGQRAQAFTLNVVQTKPEPPKPADEAEKQP